MNVEVSVSRIGRRLETDGFTQRLESQECEGEGGDSENPDVPLIIHAEYREGRFESDSELVSTCCFCIQQSVELLIIA